MLVRLFAIASSGAVALVMLNCAGGDDPTGPSAATKLAVLAQPVSVASGTAISPAVRVAIQDARGVTVTTATQTVSLVLTTGTGTSGALLGGTVAQAAVNGVATFTDLTVDKVGTGYTLTATASGAALAAATSSPFAVTPGAPAKLAVTGQPSTVPTLVAVSPPVQVTVQDANGNAATNATTSVTLALTSGAGTAGAVLGGTLTQSAVNGVARFDDLTVDKAGAGYTLTATAVSLPSIASGAFAVTPNPDSNLVGRIVYTLGGTLHIYTPITRRDVDLRVTGVNPKFSPDGSMIVFQFIGGVAIVNADGTGRQNLTNLGGIPSFDPTGTLIAFGNRDSGIWKMNVDGTGLVQLTTDGGFQPAWSPDGSQIAYSGTVGPSLQLFIMNADGTNRRHALTSNPIIDVVWRPSSKILFGVLVAEFNYELHSYDPSDATSLQRLTASADNDFEPSWSPDGTFISWSNVSNGLWIMNADGTGQRLLVPGARQGSWGR